VPKKLRNAVTGLMKAEGYGAGYRTAHDYADGHVPGEVYLPDALAGRRFYEPSNQGLEQRIGERLARLRGEAASQGPGVPSQGPGVPSQGPGVSSQGAGLPSQGPGVPSQAPEADSQGRDPPVQDDES
jgi:hypothetical protein